MNPNSNYYLSFNVGYPNAYDQAWGRTGGNIMVHGVCSSAGCFSMTDAQIADIYAVAREAFNGGQREIQMESFPFRMTPENMAKYRLDPNIAFWKELKVGADHFEVTKTEPPVLVCNRHYEFGATADSSVSAREPCPALKRDEAVEQAVAAKEASDQSDVEKLIAQGVQPVKTVYEDGGQNPAFAGRPADDVSRSDALVDGDHDIPIGAPAVAQADQGRRCHAGAGALARHGRNGARDGDGGHALCGDACGLWRDEPRENSWAWVGSIRTLRTPWLRRSRRRCPPARPCRLSAPRTRLSPPTPRARWICPRSSQSRTRRRSRRRRTRRSRGLVRPGSLSPARIRARSKSETPGGSARAGMAMVCPSAPQR